MGLGTIYIFRHKTCRAINEDYPACYIGQTTDVTARYSAHHYAMNAKKQNRFFQFAFDNHGGEGALDFEILEDGIEFRDPILIRINEDGTKVTSSSSNDMDLLNRREIYWIERLHASYLRGGFNMRHAEIGVPGTVIKAFKSQTWKGPAWHLGHRFWPLTQNWSDSDPRSQRRLI